MSPHRGWSVAVFCLFVAFLMAAPVAAAYHPSPANRADSSSLAGTASSTPLASGAVPHAGAVDPIGGGRLWTDLAQWPSPATPAAGGIDPYDYYHAEPAPMGVADYGITQSGAGAYSYSTYAVQGVVSLLENPVVSNASLGPGSPYFGIQLNVMLVFDDSAGTQFTYWCQDVVLYNTSNDQVLAYIDNIWNQSATDAQMYNSTVSGYGVINAGSGGSWYADFSNSSTPGGANAEVQAPNSITLEMDVFEATSGVPGVAFLYDDGQGEQTYDEVVFPWATSLGNVYGFVVSGSAPNPIGSPYDLELTFGGPGNSSQTNDVTSDFKLQLLYFNGNNFQSPENAFDFGSETAEGSDNVQAGTFFNFQSGNLTVHLVQGTTSYSVLNQMYTSSQVAAINFTDGSVNGTLSVNGVPTPFYGGGAFLVLEPGAYDVNLTVNGETTALGHCNLTKGFALDVSPSSVCPGGASSSPGASSGGGGGFPIALLLVLIVVAIVAVALVVVMVNRRARRSAVAPPGYAAAGPPGMTSGAPPPAMTVGAARPPTYTIPAGAAGVAYAPPPPAPTAPASPPAPPPPAAPPAPAPLPSSATSPPPARSVPARYCPRCGATAVPTSSQCPRCGFDMSGVDLAHG